ncbi:hypothetical protein LMH87_004644 [Akanthomyces muscarius]|uniref:Uncharacterized protein n=1 Tax=Akanthomyces muscarius TaxID=2231603 RepID=A0A9W8Q5N1_AKAMU|nr:hypothetical protein LMH87_004644 [Akanthomyces muscarius]KAJ4145811.1 hypothetical protein LMH87_004644 [Akanthomyces muscarius]
MPPDAHLTVAPSTVNDCSFFLKRAGLDNHDSGEFWHGGPPCHEVLINEVLTMEKLAQHPRRSIVRYHGRRVRRGRITGFYLEQLHQTLHEYAQTHAFAHIDKESF